jgi:hypothetical protein
VRREVEAAACEVVAVRLEHLPSECELLVLPRKLPEASVVRRWARRDRAQHRQEASPQRGEERADVSRFMP